VASPEFSELLWIALRSGTLAGMRLALIPVLFLFVLPAMSQQTDANALKLLDRVAQHYQDAEYLHLEAVQKSENHTELSDDEQHSVFSAYIAPGNRFRYEGQDAWGSGFIVSDGTNEWHLLASLGEYSRKPSGTFFASRYAVTGDDGSLSGARNLIQNFSFLGTGLKSAHFGADATLIFNGREVHCKVVQYGLDDFTRKERYSQKVDTSLWIDPVSLILLKEEIQNSSRRGYGSQPAPFGRVQTHTTTTVYSTIDFNFQPKPDTFTFVPPPDTKEVAALPIPYPNQPGTPDPLAARDALAEKIVAEHLGKQLPEVSVRDGDLNEVKLSRYAGHPLLIDIWANFRPRCRFWRCLQ